MSWLAVRRRVGPLDPLDALAAGPAGDRFYLEHPECDQARVGIGAVASVSVAGSNRFPDAARAGFAMLAAVDVQGDPGPRESEPQLLGGFAFAEATGTDPLWRGFGAGSLVLPELLLSREGSETWMTAVAPTSDAPGNRAALRDTLERRIQRWVGASKRGSRCVEGTEPPSEPVEHRVTSDEAPAEFVARVERALEALAVGQVEKVVTARSIAVHRVGGFPGAAFLPNLRASLPTCATFLVSRGPSTFFGASPERLLRLRGRTVTTTAVAGTAPRGRSPESDAALARALIESKKEQAEHAIVLRFLRERLGRLADTFSACEAPELLRLEGLQHLQTPISAELNETIDAVTLAGVLHPTPATGGAPSDTAAAWLKAHEGLDRGWYAGPVGWVDASGDGDFWVALRSGVAGGDTLRLFAGAGIVAESDPCNELAETRLKLNTLLQRALEF